MQASPALQRLPLVGVLIAAGATGLAAVTLPTTALVAAIVGVLGLLVLLFVRRAIARPAEVVGLDSRPGGGRRSRASRAAATSVAAEESLLRRASRIAYLLGILLLGIQLLRPFLGFTVSDLYFLGATGGAAAVAWRDRSQRGYLPPLMIAGSALFAIAALVSTIGAASTSASVLQLAKFVFIIFGWFWAGTVLLVEPQHVRVATGAWIATVAINGVAALAQALLGDVIPGGTVEWGRVAGMTDHFNDLGGSAGIALAPSIAFAALARRWWRALAWPMVLLVGIGLLLSGSVAGMITGLVGVVVFVACGGIRFRRGTVLLGLALVAIATVAMVGLPAIGAQTPLARLDVAAGAGGTLASRIQTFEQAWWSIGLDPFIGTGLAQGPTRTGYDVHNLLLGIWYQAGVVGAIGVLLVLAGTAQVAIGAVVVAPGPAARRLAVGLLGAFFAFLTLGLAQPLLLQRYAWVPAALLLALYAQARRSPGTPRDDSP
jgi:hypothetical protein